MPATLSTRDTFHAIRRAYRASLRLPVAHGSVEDGQRMVQASIAAGAALRAFTGRWDTCEPIRHRNIWDQGHPLRVRPSITLWRPTVTNAAVRFFRSH